MVSVSIKSITEPEDAMDHTYEFLQGSWQDLVDGRYVSLEETADSFESAKNKIQEVTKKKIGAQIDDDVKAELVRSGHPADKFFDPEFDGIRQKEIDADIEMEPGKITGTVKDLSLKFSAVRVNVVIRM